jgi:hypothetical protein
VVSLVAFGYCLAYPSYHKSVVECKTRLYEICAVVYQSNLSRTLFFLLSLAGFDCIFRPKHNRKKKKANVKFASIIELCTCHAATGIFLHHYWSGGGLMNVGMEAEMVLLVFIS